MQLQLDPYESLKSSKSSYTGRDSPRSVSSPFHSPAPPRTPLPSHESFPLPPLVVSIHHTFTLAEGKGTEDSSVGITIDSAKLKFSPFLAVFVEEAMYYSKQFLSSDEASSPDNSDAYPSTPTTPMSAHQAAADPKTPNSSGRGSVTVAVKFNPTTIILMGGEFTEIVCT